MKIQSYLLGNTQIEIYDDFIPKEKKESEKRIKDLNNYCIKLMSELRTYRNQGKLES